MKEPKKYNDLEFEDIDAYDMNMLRHRAMGNFLQSKSRDPNLGAAAVVEAVFAYIFLKGMRIVKDETREDTWEKPSKSWYAEYKPNKTDW